MIITIDSNVAGVPNKVTKLLPYHVASEPWCTGVCVCKNVKFGGESDSSITVPNGNDRILYDTPIAMCHDIDTLFTSTNGGVMSFIYLEAALENPSFYRIINNLPQIKNSVFLLSNGDVSKPLSNATYTVLLDKSNCGTDMVISFIARLVNTFVLSKDILHPESMLDLIRKVPNPRTYSIIANGPPVRCDLYMFGKRNCYPLQTISELQRNGWITDDCDLKHLKN